MAAVLEVAAAIAVETKSTAVQTLAFVVALADLLSLDQILADNWWWDHTWVHLEIDYSH